MPYPAKSIWRRMGFPGLLTCIPMLPRSFMSKETRKTWIKASPCLPLLPPSLATYRSPYSRFHSLPALICRHSKTMFWHRSCKKPERPCTTSATAGKLPPLKRRRTTGPKPLACWIWNGKRLKKRFHPSRQYTMRWCTVPRIPMDLIWKHSTASLLKRPGIMTVHC